MKRILSIAALLVAMSFPALAQTLSISSNAPGGAIVPKALVTVKGDFFCQLCNGYPNPWNAIGVKFRYNDGTDIDANIVLAYQWSFIFQVPGTEKGVVEIVISYRARSIVIPMQVVERARPRVITPVRGTVTALLREGSQQAETIENGEGHAPRVTFLLLIAGEGFGTGGTFRLFATDEAGKTKVYIIRVRPKASGLPDFDQIEAEVDPFTGTITIVIDDPNDPTVQPTAPVQIKLNSPRP